MSMNSYLTPPTPMISNVDFTVNETLNASINTSLVSYIESSDYMKNWYYMFYTYWREEGDSRSEHLPLLKDGIVPVTAIMAIYFIFVTIIGPKFMAKRAAFELRGPMLVYNILMVVLNAYFFFKFISLSDFGREYMKFEFPSKYDESMRSQTVIITAYLYFLTKFVDLLDTIFFVLRKKNNQITGLHLYHHTSVPFLAFAAMKLRPTVPSLQIFGVLNTFVHTVMYSYYALSSFGPSIQPYLWWKKYITQIQLIQFVILIAYGVVLGTLQTGYPQIWFWIGFAQNPLFFFLFFNFYRNSYNKRKTDINRKAQ